MRGKTLVSLLDDLRAECKLSLNPAHNAQVQDIQIKALQRAQEFLWEDFAWPHLRVEEFIPLAIGQRFYDPEMMDIDRIEKIEVKDGGNWCPVYAGIDAEQYSVYDSEIDERAWPVRRWQISPEEQVEVWPIPDMAADDTTKEGYIKITGIRKLNPLVQMDDRADLDNRLLVLYAAADIITDPKATQYKLQKASKLYQKLRNGLTPRKRFQMFGGTNKQERPLRGMPSVYYRIVPPS